MDNGATLRGDTILVATGRIPERRPARRGAGGRRGARRQRRRRRVPTHHRPRHLRTRRRELGLPAQARRQPRGPHGQGEPAAGLGRHRVPEARPITVSFRRRCSPTRRSRWSGLTENQARAKGFNIRSKVQDFSDVAYGWAMEDTTGIAKIIVDDDTGLILGAHIMGHQASSLIQPIIQAMSFGLARPGHGPRPVLDPPRAAGGHRERIAGAVRRAAVAAGAPTLTG